VLQSIPPGLILILGAILIPLVPARARGWVFLLFPALAVAVIAGLEHGEHLGWSFATYQLELLRVDGLSLVFGWVFALATLVAGIYALHNRDTGQQVAALLYAGSTLGATFAGDLFTLIFFWEIMAFASAYLVWARGTKEAYGSAMRYLFVHLFGGSLLLGGALWHIAETGSIAFDAFEGGIAAWLILGGFAVNAAVIPFHAWIADAYPRATVTGTIFMSALTTKLAVYTLARGFAGWDILIWAGCLMAVYGVIYAILCNDIRRVLSYHIVSQLGFMVAAIGIGSTLAIQGAVALAITNILYKGLLFMAAGAVIYSTGESRMSQLGGLYRQLPAVFWIYVVAGLAIASAPFLAGFISKPITIYAAEYAGLLGVVLLLHLVSVGTFLSVGLKVPYFVWFGGEPKKPIKPARVPTNMYVAMWLAVGLNVLLGVWPEPLYNMLPGGAPDYDPYTVASLTKGFQLLLFTALVFFAITSYLKPKQKIQLDTDWFYRTSAQLAWRTTVVPVERFFKWWEDFSWDTTRKIARRGFDPVTWTRTILGRPGPEVGAPGETASTTLRVSMTVMMVFLLATAAGIMLIMVL